MPCRKAAASATIVAAAIVLGLAGQPAAQAPPPAPQPSFRAGVQLVEVDVRVFDAQGRFVGDLTKDDFEVVESGEPQTISALYMLGADAVVSPASNQPPNVSDPGRAAAVNPVAPQTWIFHFDLHHLTPGGGFDRARKAVEEFIGERFKDGELAGILAGDKMVNNRLTSVKQELLSAVRQVMPRGDLRAHTLELTREWPRLMDDMEAIGIARGERQVIDRVVNRACDDEPELCKKVDVEGAVRAKGQRMQQEVHRASMQTLAALNGLASGLAKIPGPKTLVLLSDGFVIQDIETTVRSIVGQATRAGARVYAIDVRGLNRVGNPGIIDQALAANPYDSAQRFDMLEDGLNSLAVDTGGLMIRNENNIGRALDRIAEDSGRYYVLAYQPSNGTFDGSYRPIEVRVKREGIRVRARRGYLALEPARMLMPKPIVPTAERNTPETEAPSPDDALPAPAAGPVANPTTTGVAVSRPEPASADGVRLRPDSEGRIEALSARESHAASPLAAQGWEAYQRGDVESAHAAFLKAAAEPDVRPWVLYALGMSQAGLGRAADAIATWERVRQAAPDFQPVYLDLADAYAGISDLTSALAVVRQAETRWPDSADVHSAIGVIHVRRGALDDGIASLLKTSQLTPDEGLAYLNLGRAYALRYQRGRRYVTSQRRWIAPDADLRRAIEALNRCVQLGGPYATQAKEELTLLEWSKPG